MHPGIRPVIKNTCRSWLFEATKLQALQKRLIFCPPFGCPRRSSDPHLEDIWIGQPRWTLGQSTESRRTGSQLRTFCLMNLGFNGDLNGANQQLKSQICDLSPVILVSFSRHGGYGGYLFRVRYPIHFQTKAAEFHWSRLGDAPARYWWSGALLFDLGRHNWCALGDDGDEVSAHHKFLWFQYIPVPLKWFHHVSSLFFWWLNTCG